jgi:hypothetical protein
MIAVPFATVEKSVLKFDPQIQKYKSDLKIKLLKLSKDKRISKSNRRYTRELLKITNNIITAKPSTIQAYKKKFDKIVNPKTMGSKKNKAFRSRLLNTLGYGERRKDFYPKYFQEIGIEACIYCNSTLTVSVERITGKNKKKTTQARFQVDHYLPKSEYPCFSISLYNLYPTCASCNNIKSSNNVQFKLYEDKSKIRGSDFYFELNMVSVGDYLLNRDSELIVYEFQEPKSRSADIKTFNEVFAIQGIYDTQKSIAEELILKAEIYTNAYKAALLTRYPTILNSASIADRLIMGNYTSESDMHKRPMAKFMIDIAMQVGLI